MGMSTYAQGIIPPDERWKQMKRIYDACIVAKIRPPQEVTEFFNDETPDEQGVVLSIPAREWNDMDKSGVEVDLAKISKDIKIIRFVNSW